MILRRLRPRGPQDEGAALVLVVGSMLILAMFAFVALSYTVAGQRLARRDQDYNAAMAAAQSGVEDFISRLNRSSAYGRTIDCTNAAWRGPMSTTNPCGWTSTTPVGWQPVVSGATGAKDPAFHYTVGAYNGLNGTYLLTSTGRVGTTYRTVEASVGRGASTDYVYYTDFESADPANVQAYNPTDYPNGVPSDICGKSGNTLAKYWYNGRSAFNAASGPDCNEITFIGGDVLDGEVFTNDTILGTARNGLKPTFLEQVFTADPKCKNAGASNASWEDYCLRPNSVADFSGKKPKYDDPLYLKDNSGEFATAPGCHYFGATRIVFKAGTATTPGRMTVWNRTSVNNGKAPVAIALPGTSTLPSCGSLADLNSPSGATVDVPNEMVVYVAASGGAARQCYKGEIGGASGRTLPLGEFTAAKTNPTGSGDFYTADTNMLETTKFCGEGNVYVEGVVQGRVTVAAAQSVVVTGDLVLAGGLSGNDRDMLGLVATNSVEVFHPRVGRVDAYRPCIAWYSNGSCRTQSSTWSWNTAAPTNEAEVSGWPTRYTDPSTGLKTPDVGIQIAGSIQTLLHSFFVQKYNVGGDKGKLQVNGSIAQRWRGIVGRGSDGYTKLYKYDTRLQYSRPPMFPEWANASWTMRYSGEISTPQAVRR
ncbi:pilus assembly PilX family protein [Cellulomonas fimi]|uniref:Uncharacterized protein n=1 Tax=Cellulomonas fimi (strain ATCC 484 / DSM 20113 / JCM 1341 / CCUG 24087 / LMG 16345 / NBRC 15513 / NCIMB 8980 / NCTC 7547 / NRS-133) TaxID=590998 RepID=F4H084_CELFA|nr:hypothetical protein [Cellulomonas fimi]AEE46131.1 hypothetical protein Celf_2001 [Cellulomonas fimi ATCC 484]NNH08423.1 hypothetical protein [Cellulomonas fimi]VEH31754.1 Tfp pilus assembly protein PilX [Cellulomonas fimi]